MCHSPLSHLLYILTSASKGNLIGLPSVFSQLNTFQSNIGETIDNSIRNKWNELSNTLTAPQKASWKILLSKSSEAQFLFELSESCAAQALFAWRYFSSNMEPPRRNEVLDGYLKAYEFVYQDTSKVIKRRNVESKTLSELRNKWEQKTHDLENKYESTT